MSMGTRVTRTPRVAAVIVTCNRRDVIARALETLAAQTRPVDDVIVVDNGSRDGTQALLETQYPHVHLIEMGDNAGPSVGFGAGMRAAYDRGADWLWMFNDDMAVQPDALRDCLSYLGNVDGDDLGIACPWNKTDGKINRGYYWRGRAFKISRVYDRPYQADLVIFNAALVSRRLVERIGVIRPDLFMGYWEWEYCLRAKKAGFTVWILPFIALEHGTLGSRRGSTPAWRHYYNSRNQLRLAIEMRSPGQAYWWLVRQAGLTAAALWSRRLSRIESIWMVLRGGLDAVLGRMGKTIEPEKYRVTHARRYQRVPSAREA